MDCQFANAMSFEPLLCHSNHWDATQGESHFTGPSLYSTASSLDEADRSLPYIYREATDQPGPEMNSISNISHFSVTLPLDCHSDHVSVNGQDIMAKNATGLPLSQSNANVSLECHSDRFRSHFSQIHLRGRLIGRFPIYREATDQPGLEMNSPTNSSQFSVTLPLDCHSDQVSVNG